MRGFADRAEASASASDQGCGRRSLARVSFNLNPTRGRHDAGGGTEAGSAFKSFTINLAANVESCSLGMVGTSSMPVYTYESRMYQYLGKRISLLETSYWYNTKSPEGFQSIMGFISVKIITYSTHAYNLAMQMACGAEKKKRNNLDICTVCRSWQLSHLSPIDFIDVRGLSISLTRFSRNPLVGVR